MGLKSALRVMVAVGVGSNPVFCGCLWRLAAGGHRRGHREHALHRGLQTVPVQGEEGELLQHPRQPGAPGMGLCAPHPTTRTHPTTRMHAPHPTPRTSMNLEGRIVTR